MIATEVPKPKTCEYCDKVLHGRSDQRFCNDSCRNTFNRNKRAAEKIEEHANTPEIFRVIKRNYEILKRNFNRPMEKDEGAFIKNSEILKLGFNPKFCTSVATGEDGQQWKCVFEIGF